MSKCPHCIEGYVQETGFDRCNHCNHCNDQDESDLDLVASIESLDERMENLEDHLSALIKFNAIALLFVIAALVLVFFAK